MKRHSSKKLIISLAILSMICCSMTIFASAKAKSIRASLDPGYKYSYNNKAILANEPTIIYRNKVYVPLDTFANSLGFNVSARDKNIVIVPMQSPKPEPPKDITIPRAEILGINFGDNTIAILPQGKPNTLENQIILRISRNTTITDGKTKKAYSINDLNTSIPIKVVHSAMMTKSIPPQTEAITITLL